MGLFLLPRQLQPPHGNRRRGGSLPLSWLPPAAGAAPLIPRGEPQTPGPAGLLQGVSEAKGSVWHGEGKGGKKRGGGGEGEGSLSGAGCEGTARHRRRDEGPSQRGRGFRALPLPAPMAPPQRGLPAPRPPSGTEPQSIQQG